MGSRRRHRRRRHLALTVGVLVAAVAAAGGVVSAHRAASAHAVATHRADPARTSRVHRLVALGDSVATSTACSCSPFVTLAAQQLTRDEGISVQADDLAVDGLTSMKLLQQLSMPSVRAQLVRADGVVITIGANDLESMPLTTACANLNPSCFTGALRQLRTTLPQVLAAVRATTPPGARVVVTGYWNVFLDGVTGARKGPSYVLNSQSVTREVNRTISAAAAAQHDAYLDTYTLFTGNGDRDDTPLLMPDGDHPDAAGHALIAHALVGELRATGCGC